MKPSSMGVIVLISLVILLVMSTHLAYAADIGAPITKADVNGVVRTELIYEKYDRKVELSSVNVTETSTIGGTTTYTVEGETGKQEEKRIILRLLVPVGENMIIFGDIGKTDSKDSAEARPFGGLGLKYLGYNKDNTRIGFFIQGHYVSEIEYNWQDVDPIYGPGTWTQQESYYEISTGLNVAKTFLLDNKTQLVPYAGAMISILNGEEEFNVCYGCNTFGPALKITGSGELKDDGIFSVFAGADLKFRSNFGFHMEGRFINQSSLSASLFMSF